MEGGKCFFMKISKAFLAYCEEVVIPSNGSINTESSYRSTASNLIAYFGDIEISSLTIHDVRRWRAHYASFQKPDTIRWRLSCLRSVLKLMRRKGESVIDYEDIIIPDKEKKLIEFLTPDEVESFVKVVSRRTRGYAEINRKRNIAITRVLASSGIRISELCALNRDSIKNRQFSTWIKSAKPRTCYIDIKAEQAVQEYLSMRVDNNPALFITNQKGCHRITQRAARLIFETACNNSLDFDRVRPHTLRHSFATTLLSRDVDLPYIADLMGHQDINTTREYLHYYNTKLQQIYDAAML